MLVLNRAAQHDWRHKTKVHINDLYPVHGMANKLHAKSVGQESIRSAAANTASSYTSTSGLLSHLAKQILHHRSYPQSILFTVQRL